MAEPDLSANDCTVRRVPVEDPARAAGFLRARGGGVMDLIAHFWDRLPQTPPLQRRELHLVMAYDTRNVHIRTTNKQEEGDARAELRGAMLYVPKAYRADVLALDPEVAAGFVEYIRLAGRREEGPGRSDNPQPAPAPDLGAGTPEKNADRNAVNAAKNVANGKGSDIVDTAIRANGTMGDTGGGSVATGRNGVAPAIDFITGAEEGVMHMVRHLLPLVHKRVPARQMVNLVMHLPESAPTAACPEVRLARESDLPTLNRWRKLYREERGILFEADLDAWVEGQRIFVYEAGAQIVALAKFDLELNQVIEIGGVYTFPEFRKRGYGAKLVGDLAARIRTSGKIPLLQTDRENLPATRLYESLGWVPKGALARVWLTG